MSARDRILPLLMSILLAGGCATGHTRGDDSGVGPGIDAACVDDDGDGVCSSVDVCEGHDDRLDADGDATPDGCDCDTSEACSEDADCAETDTGVQCTCADGFEGTGDVCTAVDCGPLEAPADGAVTVDATTFGSTATYSCDEGYNLMGEPTRTCGADGTWSGTAPTCSVADCGPLAHPANGRVDAPGTTFGSVATYTCNPGYDLVGDSMRTCSPDRTWSGVEPTCVPVDCGPLGPPANGMISVAATTFGSTAMYSCNTGYSLTGVAARTCQADRTWSGAAPVCIPVDCGPLGPPANGSVSAPMTTYGATATYSCSSGYLLSGSSTRSCTASGTWSGAAPTCDPVDCGPLAPPANGSVSAPTTTFGSTATYSCNPGYAVSGSSTRTCQASGAWSGSAPTCTLSGCGAIGAPANGSVSAPSSAPGATATYSCNPGYRLALGQYSVCDGTTWRGSTPECRQVLTCGGCGGVYAVGDRVRAVVTGPSGASGVAAGTRGTIVASQTSGSGLEVLVQWDGWTGGHNGNCSVADCGTCTASPINNRWWTDCTQIASLRITCACSGVYHEGDPVRAIVTNPSGASGVPIGRSGTVLAGSTSAGGLEAQMQWDSWSSGHTGNCSIASCGTCTTSATNNRWWTACNQFGR